MHAWSLFPNTRYPLHAVGLGSRIDAVMLRSFVPLLFIFFLTCFVGFVVCFHRSLRLPFVGLCFVMASRDMLHMRTLVLLAFAVVATSCKSLLLCVVAAYFDLLL